MAKPPLSFWSAREVKDIARELIVAFHPHLDAQTVVYIFRSEHSEKSNKIVYGTAKKVTGLAAYLAFRSARGGEEDAPTVPDSFYVVDIAYDVWLSLTGSQRIALVDHELSHIGPDNLIGHDVEEFRGVIERHGLWRPSLKDFVEASKQIPLFEDVKSRAGAIGDALLEQLADPSSKAAKIIKPKKGGGIDKVTISSGGKSVTLTQ